MTSMFNRWFYFIQRNALWIIFLGLITGALLTYYIIHTISFNTSTEDMISSKLNWRKDYQQFKDLFPVSQKNILIQVSGNTYEQSYEASLKLLDALEKKAEFEDFNAFSLSPFLVKNRLLYLNPQSLQQLLYQLPTIAPLLSLGKKDLNLYLKLIEGSLDKPGFLEKVDLFFNDFSRALEANQKNEALYISFVPLFTPKGVEKAPTYQLIELKPKVDYQSLTPGKEAIQLIQNTFDELHLASDYDVTLHLTGEIVLNYEELKSVSLGASSAAIGSFVLVLLLLIFSFRSLPLVLVSAITLILGLIYTAAFATFAIGHLNMISVAFAVLYIGLSIDFSIHIILHLKENRPLYEGRTKALLVTTRDLAPPLFLCALTTCIGFYAFIPTAFSGVSELGMIAGTGMIISFLLNFSFLPAFLSKLSIHGEKAALQEDRWSTLRHLPYDHAKPVIILSLFMFALSAFLLTKVDFNPDPMDLRDSKQASVITYRQLDQALSFGLAPITLLVEGDQAAKDAALHLQNLPFIAKTLTLQSFVPPDQPEKLQWIHKIKQIMELPTHQAKADETVEARIKGLQNLYSKLGELKENPTIRALKKALHRYLNFLEPLDDALKQKHLDDLSTTLLSGLHFQVQALKQALNPQTITEENLPEFIKKRWVNDNVYRVDAFETKNMNKDKKEAFIKEILNIYPHATGLPIIHELAGQAVTKAFQQAFSLALILIVILMLLTKRSLKEIALSLIPLLGASLFTAAATVLLKLPFNFANIIALPLLLGMGVDNGIHLIHRYANQEALRDILHTSTSKAVIASTLTTLFSFVNLAFSPHLGMRSLGILLSIGMMAVLLYTLILLPALLKWLMKDSTSN